jgi:hypothetical protein
VKILPFKDLKSNWSLQLAIFAAAPIETSGSCLPFFARALTIRQPTPSQLYCVFYTGVYLILHTPITGPTTSHN